MIEDDEDAEDDSLTPDVRSARHAARRRSNNPDLRAHQHTLIILLVDSLRSVVEVMSTLKAQRVERMKKEVEERFTQQIKRRRNTTEAQRRNGTSADGEDHSSATGASADGIDGSAFPASLSRVVSSGLHKLGVQSASSSSSDSHLLRASAMPDDLLLDPHRTDGESDAPDLTPFERSQLLEENHHLLDSLEENLDHIRRAEQKMSDIGSLLSLFATKVVEQEEQIHTIYDHAIQSTLHVHSGIAQLKKAAQRGVTFRMMILFMILMLSFAMLFLDWYMP